MAQHIKEAIHRLSNQLQLVLSHIEAEQYPEALQATKLAVREIRQLAKNLTGLCNDPLLGQKVPLGGAVVVPKGTKILHHEDVNVDVPPDEVRTVEHSEVREGFPHKRPYKSRGPTLPGEKGGGHGSKE